jgi:hypothetical protein
MGFFFNKKMYLKIHFFEKRGKFGFGTNILIMSQNYVWISKHGDITEDLHTIFC